MTLPARIAFDPALPVKATQAFAATAERSFAQGEAVDWRELGITENTLHIWWLSGLVYFEPAPEQATLERKKHRHAERR
jgi:hypothetical protein